MPPTELAAFIAAYAGDPDLAWLLQVDAAGEWRYVGVNPRLLEWAGLTDPTSVIGILPSQALPPQPATVYVRELDALVATGVSRAFSLRYTAAGDEVSLDVELHPIHDREGRLTHVLGRAADITTDDTVAAELAALCERVSEVYGAVRIGVAVIDLDGAIKWANPALADVLRRPVEQLPHCTLTELVHADDIGVEEGVPVLPNGTVRLLRGDGDVIWARLSSSLVSSTHGETLYSLLQVEDVTAAHRAEERVRERDERFRSLAGAAPIGIFFTDPHGALLSSNLRMAEIAGRTEEELLGAGWVDTVHPDDLPSLQQAMTALPTAPELAVQCRLLRPSGEVRWVNIRLAGIHDAAGTLTGLAGILEDVTVRVWSEQALIEREAEYRLLASMSSDLISRHEPDGSFIYASPASQTLLGMEPIDLIGRRLVDLVHPDDVHQFEADARRLETRDQATITCRVRRADGTFVWVEARARNLYDEETGERLQLMAVTRDISEHKRSEQLLAHQALHDPLTGLPNRALLMDRLTQALAGVRKQQVNTAVLFLDLDGFKMVNDSLGHEAGDRLLVAVADRLRRLVRVGDTVARFGGDEFVVLCPATTGGDEVLSLAERLTSGFTDSFEHIGDGDVFATASIGIAFANGGDASAENLLRDADVAMYRAKERGGVRYEVFNEALRSRIVERLEIANALHHALERAELRLYYQPIIEVRSGRTTGVEALLRWSHPIRGLVLPGDFISVAEATGLVSGIGAWVLREACRQLRVWTEAGGPVPTVAVNLSARQLVEPGIVECVAAALAGEGVDPSLVCLEVTESTVMEDPEASIELLEQLRRIGVAIAIDDFGTGYSSLSYLKRLPVDRLKVDRSFVSGLGDKLEDTAIVTAVINLAHTLGLQAVAEGVESNRQLAELRALGCDYAQGFLFARPLPPEIVTRGLARVG